MCQRFHSAPSHRFILSTKISTSPAQDLPVELSCCGLFVSAAHFQLAFSASPARLGPQTGAHRADEEASGRSHTIGGAQLQGRRPCRRERNRLLWCQTEAGLNLARFSAEEGVCVPMHLQAGRAGDGAPYPPIYETESILSGHHLRGASVISSHGPGLPARHRRRLGRSGAALRPARHAVYHDCGRMGSQSGAQAGRHSRGVGTQ